MRTVNTDLVDEYAEQLRELLPLARTAYGTQGPNSPARQASDKVNELLLEYAERGGNITHLSRELDPEEHGDAGISLPGLRRRLRSAKTGNLLGGVSTSRKRGSKDPERVAEAARKIDNARAIGTASYGQAVREVYSEGISLSAVAKELDMSYFSLWTAGSHG